MDEEEGGGQKRDWVRGSAVEGHLWNSGGERTREGRDQGKWSIDTGLGKQMEASEKTLKSVGRK